MVINSRFFHSHKKVITVKGTLKKQRQKTRVYGTFLKMTSAAFFLLIFSKGLYLLCLPSYTTHWFLSDFTLPHPKICCETSEFLFLPKAIHIFKQHGEDTQRRIYYSNRCYLKTVGKLVISSYSLSLNRKSENTYIKLSCLLIFKYSAMCLYSTAASASCNS